MKETFWLLFFGILFLVLFYSVPYVLITKSRLQKERLHLKSKETALAKLITDTQELNNSLLIRTEQLSEKEKALNIFLKEKSTTSPWLIALWQDHDDYLDKCREDELRTKDRPALKAADQVKAIRSEKRYYVAQTHLLHQQMSFLQSQFPWISEYLDLTADEVREAADALKDESDFSSEYDSLRSWLSPEEYCRLSDSQRYQLALNRYVNRKRSNWAAGIDYERYIGYLYEKQGFLVKYNGATTGLQDMGRDLIVSFEDNVKIIQCKRLSKTKNRIVHENVIFQLHGSCVQYHLSHPSVRVTGAIYTTTQLSDVARACALAMGIEVHENFSLADYPMIKCNIGNDGIKRFHLPFSQMYDRLHISPAKGDFYATTVQEAMDAGFVKAKRWTGNQ